MSFVATEVVRDDDVARGKRWGEQLLDIGEEELPLMAPSSTHGASILSWRSAAREVSVRQRPNGTFACNRWPRWTWP